MDSKQQQLVLENLVQLRQDIIRDVHNSQEASLTLGLDGVADLGDMAANACNRDMLMNFSETQRQTLADIDMAIARIDEGEYGVCMECEETIDPKRLEVRPFSRYCVECKTEIEKQAE